MDLFVELPDGTTKLVAVSLNCSVRAATQSTIRRAGMAPVASKLTEFSLAKKTENSNPLVDVCWLDQGLLLKDQAGEGGLLRLVLLKKYFSANTDLSLLSSSSILLKNIYSQLRCGYVSGLYRCTQAAQLSALIARTEFSLSELRPGSLQKTELLEGIIPPPFLKSPDIEQDILKALSLVTQLTESKAQEQFIELIRKSDTFGLTMYTITLVESGGESREALLGVGPQHISVMEKSLQVLMQWKTSDLTQHSFDKSTFTMVYGSESVTIVTKHGHMISSFLSGMGVPSPSNGAPGNKKPAKPPKPASIVENGHVDSNGVLDRIESTHIKSVGKSVERYEAHLQQSRPTAPPRTRVPPVRPPQPPKPRHAALRPTRSVPIQPVAPPALPISLIRSRGVATRNTPTNVDSIGEGALYEVPIQRKQAGRGKGEEKNTPLAKWEEAHYEMIDTNEEKPPKSVQRVRPLLPPPPQGRKQLLKRKQVSRATNDDAEKHLAQNNLPSLRKTHKSDSDITCVSVGDASPSDSPVYDELTQPPEYAEPGAHSQPLSRDRGSKHMAVKRKSQISTPVTHTPFSNPLSPPPPSSPAPPPPSAASERVAAFPRGGSSHAPPPQIQAPEPPVYDTLTPEDDMKEIEDVFGSKDLPMQVKYSCDTNPIYDTLAATKVNSSLSNSDVTFHSFTSTLERRNRKPKLPKAASQPQTPCSPPSSSPLSSSSPQPSSPHDYENSELLSLLMKDISRVPPVNSAPAKTRLEEPQKEKPRKKTPSPPLHKTSVEGQLANGSKVDETVSKPQHLLVPSSKPSYGYSRLDHFHGGKTHVPSQPLLEVPKSGSTSDDDVLNHEYAKVNDAAPKSAKRDQRKQSSSGKAGGEDSNVAPPLPPLRGVDGEDKKAGPPKPPRIRQRWEKKVEKREGKGHKAIKNADVLRDYSTLLQEFRIFHVKLPTGVVHTELANVKSEVGKLIKRLCVLLCVNEEDHTHYSLYVEGASFTHLTEMEDDNGGEVFQRLQQKNSSRSDLFSNNKSFAVLSERSTNPILLDPTLSFRGQGITTTRILALRPQTMLPSKLTRFQIRVPDWVRFHQCWLSVVQGNLVSTLQEAIKLAALQYQAYFMDRTELNSVIGFCRSSDFLPQDYASVKGIEEKVFAEQQLLKGYTRVHAQDSYIFTACSLPTYNTVFFHCLEVKRRRLRIQHPKLASVLIGMNKEGVVRADYKTKEILDVWPYKVLKNWGYTEQTFILEFDDRTYPLKTSQGRWMNAMIDFYIESILGDMTTPPVTHQELGGATALDEVVQIPHNRDNVDEIYSDLLSVRAQAQQWLAETNNGKPSSSSSPPSSPPPTPHTPSFAPLSPSQSHATSISTKQDRTNQIPPKPTSPPVYEEVDFEPVPRTVGFYDVLRKEDEDD